MSVGTTSPVVRVAGAVVLTVLLGLVLVQSGGPVHDEPTRLSACVRTGPRSSVGELNAFIGSAHGIPGFLGADIALDVRLPRQRSLWFFGDTLRSTASGEELVRNSVLVFTPGCARLVVTRGRGAVVPDRVDGVGYWPMSAWHVERGGTERVYVMMQRVADDPTAGFSVVTAGPSLAVFKVSASGLPTLERLHDLGSDDVSPSRPEWGAASALADGWLYLYGTSTSDRAGIHGFALRVARVRPAHVGDETQWRYWDGRSWVAQAARAQPLIAEKGGVSQTLSVWQQDGRWYVLSKRDEFLGRHIVIWPGRSPTGPFGPPHVVADIACDAATGALRYMPLAHPGLLPEAGTVVVSYSRNLLNFAQVCSSPSSYRPYFLRVTLPR